MVSVVSDGFTVVVFGLDNLIDGLKGFRPKAVENIRKTIRKGGEDVARDAKSFASRFAFTGAYAASFGVRQLGNGVKVYSSDPGAGAIEFAAPHAMYLHGKLRGRTMAGPYRIGAPRALIPAVEKNEPDVIREVARSIQDVLDEIKGA